MVAIAPSARVLISPRSLLRALSMISSGDNKASWEPLLKRPRRNENKSVIVFSIDPSLSGALNDDVLKSFRPTHPPPMLWKLWPKDDDAQLQPKNCKRLHCAHESDPIFQRLDRQDQNLKVAR